jgi:hypothetical protein
MLGVRDDGASRDAISPLHRFRARHWHSSTQGLCAIFEVRLPGLSQQANWQDGSTRELLSPTISATLSPAVALVAQRKTIDAERAYHLQCEQHSCTVQPARMRDKCDDVVCRNIHFSPSQYEVCRYKSSLIREKAVGPHAPATRNLHQRLPQR